MDVKVTCLSEARVREIMKLTRAVAQSNRNRLASAPVLLVTDDPAAYRAMAVRLDPRYAQTTDRYFSDDVLLGRVYGQTTFGRVAIRKGRVLSGPETMTASMDEWTPASAVYLNAGYLQRDDRAEGTLVHELCHAYAGRTMGHNYSWRRLLVQAAAVTFAPSVPAVRKFAAQLVHRYTQQKGGYRAYAREDRDQYNERVAKEVEDLVRRALPRLPPAR